MDKARMLDLVLINTCGKSLGEYEGKPAILHVLDLHCAEAVFIVEDADSSKVMFFKITEEGTAYVTAVHAGFSEVPDFGSIIKGK